MALVEIDSVLFARETHLFSQKGTSNNCPFGFQRVALAAPALGYLYRQMDSPCVPEETRHQETLDPSSDNLVPD